MKLWHLYTAIGAVGLVLTGSQALGYFSAGPIAGTVDFWRDAFNGNDASRFLAVDILYTIVDPPSAELLTPDRPGLVRPGQVHRVETLGKVRMQVEFYDAEPTL